MREENLKEMIQKAKDEAVTDEARQFVTDFESFIELRETASSALKPEGYEKKLSEAHGKFMQSFAKAATRHGIAPEALKKQIEGRAELAQNQVVKNNVKDAVAGRSLARKFRNQQKNVRV